MIDKNMLLFSCQKNEGLNIIQAKNSSFSLIVLLSGKLGLWIGEEQVVAEAPCCICLDESRDRKVDGILDAEYYCIHFHPEFLDSNMTFEVLRTGGNVDVARIHEIILLEPFFRKRFTILSDERALADISRICAVLQEEMAKEKDMHWYFRCRSYFMEILIVLERMNNITKQFTPSQASVQYVFNDRVKTAVRYIENHYREKITLRDIVVNCGLNHTTLTMLMKQEVGKTPMEYLLHYRIRIARRQLAVPEIPIKEIALNCGFKTVEHFSRAFKEINEKTPGEYRENKLKKKMEKEEKGR